MGEVPKIDIFDIELQHMAKNFQTLFLVILVMLGIKKYVFEVAEQLTKVRFCLAPI